MDGFLANIKQRRERDPSVCINCGVKPRDDGYQYCSKECAREAQARLLGKAPIPTPPPAPAPAPAPQPPADDSDDSDGSVLSDPNLCEECHKRPKHYDSSRGILYQFCGRRCRDANAIKEAQPHCKLKGCKRTFNSNDDYCSQEHAQEAVRRGEAQPCPVCNVNPVASGFKHCSRECAVKQANQPKMNGPSRSGSSHFGAAAYPSPPPPGPPPPGNRGSMPPPPTGPSNGADKDADAPVNPNPGSCEHCGTRPKSVKVHRHCSKECAKAAKAGKKGGYGDSDEDSWPEDAPPSKKPQPSAYDEDDDGWGNVQSPLPQQPQANPGNSKTYSCCSCTITVPSGSPPAECPVCKLAEVKKELEAEKAKPPVVIRIPQSPPPPAPAPPPPVQAPAPPSPAPLPVTPAPAPISPPAPAPQPKAVQTNSFIRPGGPVPLPGMRKPTPTATPTPPPQPSKTAKQPVPPVRRPLDEEDDDDDDDDDEEFFVRHPEPPPPKQAPPATVESDDDDDDFFVR